MSVPFTKEVFTWLVLVNSAQVVVLDLMAPDWQSQPQKTQEQAAQATHPLALREPSPSPPSVGYRTLLSS